MSVTEYTVTVKKVDVSLFVIHFSAAQCVID